MRTARSWLLIAALVTLVTRLAVGGRSGLNVVTVAAPPLDHVPVDTCPVARGELAGLVALTYLVTIDKQRAKEDRRGGRHPNPSRS